MDEAPGVSVVIPSLGGEVLRDTISRLNAGDLVPAEILVCIPADRASEVCPFEADNVRIIETDFRGQVRQRAAGFERIESPLVLQFDDDILVDKSTLRVLVNAVVELGPGNVVAPIYADLGNGKCLHAPFNGFVGLLQNVYAWVICGAPWGPKRMGVITPAGVAYGVDAESTIRPLIEVEWIPGGCVLSFRDDLILGNFFPFPGKAFCEDLVHSLLRRKRGCRLWVVPNARCSTIGARTSETFRQIVPEFRTRLYVVRLMGGSVWRLGLWSVVDTAKRFIAFIFSAVFARVRSGGT